MDMLKNEFYMIFLTEWSPASCRSLQISAPSRQARFQEAVKIHLLQIMILADNTTNKSNKPK